MKAFVNVSVWTPSGPYGRFHGEFEFSVLPRQGEHLCFLWGESVSFPHDSFAWVGDSVVEEVTYNVGGVEILLELSKIEVESQEGALDLETYLCGAFGMRFSRYDNDGDGADAQNFSARRPGDKLTSQYGSLSTPRKRK